ncbi:SRPBCC family protein [Actinospongicola halichondriae]|uniref:SRPBCC family protein n=1 Tax=Actinospongicola halichondriae TaxID=3236844 RepID=UPI003D4E6014
MSSTETTIDLDVPVELAYRKWASLENLPDLLSVVDRIDTDDGEISHWTITLGPVTREFDARVTEVQSEKRIAWKSITGPEHAGVITFHRIDEHRSRIGLQLDFEPDGVAETIAAGLQLVESAIEYDLGAFKASVE